MISMGLLMLASATVLGSWARNKVLMEPLSIQRYQKIDVIV